MNTKPTLVTSGFWSWHMITDRSVTAAIFCLQNISHLKGASTFHEGLPNCVLKKSFNLTVSIYTLKSSEDKAKLKVCLFQAHGCGRPPFSCFNVVIWYTSVYILISGSWVCVCLCVWRWGGNKEELLVRFYIISVKNISRVSVQDRMYVVDHFGSVWDQDAVGHIM